MPYVTLPSRGELPTAKIYYELEFSLNSDNSNRPTMIMLPGGPGGSLNIYDVVRRDLSRYSNLVLIDPRGCGRSDESEARFCTINNFIDDINVIQDLLRIEKPIIFGGSYGSMAALGYAIKFPNNLSKLICIAGSARLDINLAMEKLKQYKANEEQIYWANKLFKGDIKNLEESAAYYQTMMSLYVFKKNEDSVHKTINKNENKFEPTARKRDTTHIFREAFKEGGFLRTFDWRPNLHMIKAPTRLIFGDHDWINDITLGVEIKNLIASGGAYVDLIEIKNCGHFQWLDQYEVFIESINEFLRK